MIDETVTSLINTFGVRPPVAEAPLQRLFETKDYIGMVRLIKSDICKDARIRLGLINSGGNEKTPARVSMPDPMPMYGTREFKQALITMYIRKSFLRECTYTGAAAAIAHECAHIVLDSIGHSLKRSEEAVDITAMILGYRRLHIASVEQIIKTRTQLPKLTEDPVGYIVGLLSRETHVTVHTLGYLSKAESEYASHLIELHERRIERR